MIVKTNGIETKFKRLISSEDDIEIRAFKFHIMSEAETLGNEIWKLQLRKNKINSFATKLENKERELLGFPKIKLK